MNPYLPSAPQHTLPVLPPLNLETVLCQKSWSWCGTLFSILTGLVGAKPLAPLPAAEGSLSPWRPFSFTGGMWWCRGASGSRAGAIGNLILFLQKKGKSKTKKKWHSNNPKTLARTCMRKRPQALMRLCIAMVSGACRLPEHMSHANAPHGNLFTMPWHALTLSL